MKKGVVVTGASGWLGKQVCRRMLERETEVLACDLAPPAGGKGVTGFCLDITRPIPAETPELRQWLETHQVLGVVHCAGYAHRPVETEEVKTAMYAVNEKGAAAVVSWAKQLGVDRVVYLSSIAFYDWEKLKGRAADEEAPVSGRTAYAASKLEGEKRVLEQARDPRVLRLATVFGKGDSANFSKLAASLHAGRMILPGAGGARKSVLPVDVAACVIAEAVLREAWPHRILNVGLEKAPSLSAICGAFQRQCECPPVRTLPVALLRFLAMIGDGVAKVRPGFPLTRTVLGKLTTDTRVDCGKAVEIFPEWLKVDFETALAGHADSYRKVEGGS